MNYEEKQGLIFVQPFNTMSGTYRLIGSDNSDIESSITPYLFENNEVKSVISVRAIGKNNVLSLIDVKYFGYDEVISSIQPVGHVDKLAEIEIPSHNRMWGIYEIIQPPRITDILYPEKDAYTRSEPPYNVINYGDGNSLLVGKNDNNIYRTFIRFNIASLDKQITIVDAKLRLYYSGLFIDGMPLEIYTVNETWNEFGITDSNKPVPDQLVTLDYTLNRERSYIEFNFLDIVSKWYENSIDNFGITIQSNNIDNLILFFKSRESYDKPELIVTYYDNRVYSATKTQVDSEIFVYQVDNSDITSQIEVGSVFTNDDRCSELYVHRAEIPILNDIQSEITVSKDKVNSLISVARTANKYLYSDLTVKQSLSSWIDSSLTISKPVIQGTIFVSYKDDLDSELTVQKHNESDLDSLLIVNREQILSSIYVKYYNQIESELTIQRHGEFDINSLINVSRDSVDSLIYVKHRSDINSEISVIRDDIEEIYSDLSVTRPQINSSITIKQFGNNDVDSQIVSRAISEHEKQSEIIISREVINSEITVSHFVNIDSEIYVKHRNDINAEINITVFKDVESVIDVLQHSNIESELTISRSKVESLLIVPYWEDNDLISEMEVRALLVSDINSELIVKSTAFAYYFIM